MIKRNYSNVNNVQRRKPKTRVPRAVLYPRLPQSMKVLMKGRTYDTGTSVTSPVWNKFGLVEFLQRGGSFTDSLFGLYQAAVTHGCRIHLRLINMSSEPILLAVAPLPYGWTAGSPTMNEILDSPRCVRTTVGSNSGMDRVAISNFATSRDVLGKDYQAAKYVMDATQAASSTPLNPEEPCWVVGLSAFNSLTSISYRLEVELEFNAEFFNLTSA